jgi:uncharacterized protein (UPF0335 family)
MKMSNDVVRKLAESISAIRGQIEDLEADEKQYYDSAKDQGINTAELKRAIKIMRMDADKREKTFAMRDLFDEYVEAIGVKR